MTVAELGALLATLRQDAEIQTMRWGEFDNPKQGPPDLEEYADGSYSL